jgi:hypothetical protein
MRCGRLIFLAASGLHGNRAVRSDCWFFTDLRSGVAHLSPPADGTRCRLLPFCPCREKDTIYAERIQEETSALRGRLKEQKALAGPHVDNPAVETRIAQRLRALHTRREEPERNLQQCLRPSGQRNLGRNAISDVNSAMCDAQLKIAH